MIDRLERLLNLVIALRETHRPLQAAEIRRTVAGYGQDDHEAFRRMFERDKADLRALGVPVEVVPLDRFDDRTGYRIDPRRYDLPPVALEPDELAALALALQATGLADEAGTALRKLEVDADRPGATDAVAPPPLSIDLGGPHRDLLLEAQRSRTTVRFTYRRPGQPAAERTVDPHALVHRRGRWYLVGRDHDRDARRAFRLDRIAGGLRTVGEPGAFPPAPDVGLDDVVPAPPPGAPEVAEVLAAPEVAWQVARRAVGGGAPAAPPPGGGDEPWTAFPVRVRDPEELVDWVLELAPDVVVTGPPELRAAVVERLRQGLHRDEGVRR